MQLDSIQQQLPVFVYGTLRTGECNYRRLLAEVDETSSSATLSNAVMYVGPGFPYVTTGDGIVVGDLIQIAPRHYATTMNQLDMLEGYRGPGERNHYDRIIATVTNAAGDQLEAWVYLAGAMVSSQLSERQRIFTGDWLAEAFEGAPT